MNDDNDPGAPTMLRFPREIARVIAENIQAFATHQDATAHQCSTNHGREAAAAGARALRSYAEGLMEAST